MSKQQRAFAAHLAQVIQSLPVLFAAGEPPAALSPTTHSTPIPTTQSPQRLMPAPKVALNPTQSTLALQDELITACEEGDIKKITHIVGRGPHSNPASTAGKRSFAIAVHCMNPEGIDALLKQTRGVSPITWEECELHNRHHYNDQVFMVPKFNLESLKRLTDWEVLLQWSTLLEQIAPSPFLRERHLKLVADTWGHDVDCYSWEHLHSWVLGVRSILSWDSNPEHLTRIGKISRDFLTRTEWMYDAFRSQIKKKLDTAQPQLDTTPPRTLLTI